MNGLQLAEQYFNRFGAPMIEEKLPEYRSRIAAGLVGDGSECFGFDDEISRDHDWGPSFCLWLCQPDYETVAEALKKELDQLPKTFDGIEARQESDWGSGRTGVFEISTFYKRFIGFDRVPETLREWRMIPETHLAAATNGKVFTDPLGEFTVFRNKLKALYPEDIRLKKIASRCMTMAQSGQYNYMRCIKRGEFVTAQQAEAQFIDHAISMVFLLNKAFKPFYKWMHRAMRRLPILGKTVFGLLSEMTTAHERFTGAGVYKEKSRLMEDVCRRIITELKMMELSESQSDFLLDHGPMVQNKIEDSQIRALNVWIE